MFFFKVLRESSSSSKEVYTPSRVYTPIFNRMPFWGDLKEKDEEEDNVDSSSGIGSLLSPVSTRSSGTASLLSPMSTRTNVTVTVADVHRFDETQEEIEQTRDTPDNTIYTVWFPSKQFF